MRFVLFLALIGSPAFAQDDQQSIWDMDCMAVFGPVAYGTQTFSTGVTAGVAIGYALANGWSPDRVNEAGQALGAACRNTPGMTFREALTIFDQD